MGGRQASEHFLAHAATLHDFTAMQFRVKGFEFLRQRQFGFACGT
jgi:hypothetical protein